MIFRLYQATNSEIVHKSSYFVESITFIMHEAWAIVYYNLFK